MRKTIISLFCSMVLLLPACGNGVDQTQMAETVKDEIGLTQKERDSIEFGEVNPGHPYYSTVADVAQYIQEMSIYDEELDKKYIIHITLPPDYDEQKSYPMYLMTDGIWRLSDHGELRPMMADKEIEDIIMVSVGLNYGRSEGDRTYEFTYKNDYFLDFITSNLVPYLSSLYHIDYSRSALVGHSLGGLFAYYAVFSHDQYKNSPFHYYVISSPVLMAECSGITENFIAEYFERNLTFDKEIYLVAGDQETSLIKFMDDFVEEAESFGITTIDYEIFEGDHSSYFKAMLRKSLLKFYGLDK